MSDQKKWHKAIKSELEINLGMVNSFCKEQKYGAANAYVSGLSKCLDQLQANKPDLNWMQQQADAYHNCMVDESTTLEYHAKHYVSMYNAIKEIEEEEMQK